MAFRRPGPSENEAEVKSEMIYASASMLYNVTRFPFIFFNLLLATTCPFIQGAIWVASVYAGSVSMLLFVDRRRGL